MMERKAHWEKVYSEKKATEVSWYQEKPRMSLELIGWGMGGGRHEGTEARRHEREAGEEGKAERGLRSGAPELRPRHPEAASAGHGTQTGKRNQEGRGAVRDARGGIIDVGGGASVLVDCLLDAGFGDVTVLDVSGCALEAARARLGERAKQVAWIESDVTEFEPARTWQVWHDRAVFHFLTDAGDRRKYVRALKRAVAPGGFAVISTFAPDGPPMCSGLNVMRNDARGVLAELGEDEFELVRSEEEKHVTPWGKEQRFVYGVFGRKE